MNQFERAGRFSRGPYIFHVHLYSCIESNLHSIIYLHSFIQFRFIYSDMLYHMNPVEGASRFSRGAYIFHVHSIICIHSFNQIYIRVFNLHSFIQFTFVYSDVSYHMNQVEGAGRGSQGPYSFHVHSYSCI